MAETRTGSPPPPKARAAAALFGAYGLLMLVGVAVLQAGAAEAVGLGRLGVRVVAIWIIAAALWRGSSWAWMAGLVLPGLWILLGGYSLGRLLVADGASAVPGFATVFVGVALALLATAWGLLLSRDVRVAYQRQAS